MERIVNTCVLGNIVTGVSGMPENLSQADKCVRLLYLTAACGCVCPLKDRLSLCSLGS